MKCKIGFLLSALAAAIVSGCGAPYAENVRLYGNYTDNMVLQRDREVLICGASDPDRTVVVRLDDGDDQEEFEGVSDAKGEWKIAIPSHPSDGKKYTLSAFGRDEARRIECGNVVFGEVWICSGQSNMEMPVAGGRFWSVLNAEEELADADRPDIRLFDASGSKYTSILDVQKEPRSAVGWEVCTPDSVRRFSACAYFFGRRLNDELNVPVGLVSAAWSGTPIQPWISLDAYEKHDRAKEVGIVKSLQPYRDPKLREARYRAETATLKANFNLWRQRMDRKNETAVKAASAWLKPDFDDRDWAKGDPVFAPDVDGVMVFRYVLELPESWAGRELVLELGPIDDVDEAYFNGVKVGATGIDSVDFWKKPRRYPVPGELVRAGKNVIAIRVLDFGGGGGMYEAKNAAVESGAEKLTLDFDQWKSKLEYSLSREELSRIPRTRLDSSFNSAWTPTTLFNSMLAPWSSYAMRGMLWYQGCSNAGQVDYYDLHRMLIEDVRFQRGEPDFPFILVQLAGFAAQRPGDRLSDDTWKTVAPTWNVPFALTREIQQEMLELPMVGMATALDIGDQFDIHPGNKKELGRRLAQEAMRICYSGSIPGYGPVFDRAEFANDHVRIYFKNLSGGLATRDNQEAGAMMLEYSDGTLEWKTGKIDGDTVVIELEPTETRRPTAVAYGWCSYRGDLNLINGAGFPALPFRSNRPKYDDGKL